MERNSAGESMPAFGVLPAHERLDARGLLGRHVDDRLVAHDDLAAADRTDELLGQLATVVDAAHADRRTAPGPLVDVHLAVGGGDERLRVRRPVRPGAADAREHLDRTDLDGDRLGDRVLHLPAQPGDDRRGDRGIGVVDRGDHEELVASVAGDEGARVRRGDLAQPRAHGAQHRVAGVVAEQVVDRLEPVEVEEGERDRLARGQQPGEVAHRQAPVGQVGQLVVEGLVLERALGLAQPREVVRGDDEAGDDRVGVQVDDGELVGHRRAGRGQHRDLERGARDPGRGALLGHEPLEHPLEGLPVVGGEQADERLPLHQLRVETEPPRDRRRVRTRRARPCRRGWSAGRSGRRGDAAARRGATRGPTDDAG